MSKASQGEKAVYATREHALYGMFDRGERDRQYVLDALAAIIEGKFDVSVEPEVYRVTLDNSKSFEATKLAAGPWTYWNTDINEDNFALEMVEGEVELRLYHFNEAISDAEATRRLDEMGLIREDRLPVILAFLEAKLDLQRQFPIITGAAWVGPDGSHSVVCAVGDSRNRRLDLIWDGSDWLAGCRFLVRRK